MGFLATIRSHCTVGAVDRSRCPRARHVTTLLVWALVGAKEQTGGGMCGVVWTRGTGRGIDRSSVGLDCLACSSTWLFTCYTYFYIFRADFLVKTVYYFHYFPLNLSAIELVSSLLILSTHGYASARLISRTPYNMIG